MLALMIGLLAQAAASAAEPKQPTTYDGATGSLPVAVTAAFYDAKFKPLKRSEAEYAKLGPVGPCYPDRAARQGVRGGAVIGCRVESGGVLTDCRAMAEKPADFGFSQAALVMARRGVITVGTDAPVGEIVHVRVMFDTTAKAAIER